MNFVTILLTTCMVAKLAFSAKQSTVSILRCSFHDFPQLYARFSAIFIKRGIMNALRMIHFLRCNFSVQCKKFIFQRFLGCVSQNIRIHLYWFDGALIKQRCGLESTNYKQGHPTTIFGKNLFGRRFQIQSFRNKNVIIAHF